MCFFKNLRCEWRTFVSSPVKFFIPAVITVAVGWLVWLSSDGITVVWKASFHPAGTLPLWLMFSLWIAVYFMYGLLVSIGKLCSLGTELCGKSVVAYVASLFWCPTVLLAGVGICGLCAIITSLAYTLYILKFYARISVIGTVCSLFIVIFEVYLLFFTVGFTILN